MKFRTRSLVLLLSASLIGVASVPLLPSKASAQDQTVLKMARERFREGVNFFDEKKYDAARAAFLQAYALKKHPTVLLNLAQSELRSGHQADAAKHFSKFLRDAKQASPAERQNARKGLTAAKVKVAEITLHVNQPASGVFVDNRSQGTTPLPGPVYLEPGHHTIEARKGGRKGTISLSAVAGMTRTVNLVIGAPPTTLSAAGTGAVTPPANEAAGAASFPASGGEAESSASTGGGREPFFQWFEHNKLAWVGGGVTLLGLGTGIGFALAAHSAYGSANDGKAKMINDAKTRTTLGPCSAPAILGGRYVSACQQHWDNVNTGNTDKTLSVVGFVLAGVAAGGTVVYYFVDSKKKPDADADATAGGVRAAFVPIISPSEGGLGVVGTF